MGYLFTRHQLYELVWAGPVSALAKSLKVSDVALAKACRRGDIPLPPRGYWMKLNAGKGVTKTPLPLRAPGAADQVEVGSGRRQVYDDGVEEQNAPKTAAPPEPPSYEETLDAVENRIQKTLPKAFRSERSLDNAHPVIRRLLLEDQARREMQAKSGYSWDGPRFASRFEQRRLCILSNLFMLLGHYDAQPIVRGREARELSLRVGCQNVGLIVDKLAKVRPRSRSTGTADREPMAIEVEIASWQHGEAEERLFWSDGDDGKLESRLKDVAVAIVFAGERQYRKGRQFFYEMDVRSYQERTEKARQQREEAAQRERERLAQAEADRVGCLLSQVTARQQAWNIREYVKEVQASAHATEGRAFDGERDSWAAWALGIADRLDPLAPMHSRPVVAGGAGTDR